MSLAKNRDLVSVDDYLAGELRSPTKHEYVGGVVYAMAGRRNAHNLIATNTLGELGIDLPIRDIYDGIEFAPEPEENE